MTRRKAIEEKEKTPCVETAEVLENSIEDANEKAVRLQALTKQEAFELAFSLAEEHDETAIDVRDDTCVPFDEKTRQRAWWFLLYPESMNQMAMEVLASYRGCVSPLHDRDRWPDGTFKKAHYHVIVYEEGKTSAKALRGLVKHLNGAMLEPVGNIVGACRYLCHFDLNPDKNPADQHKVRYDANDIWTFGGFDVKEKLKATSTQLTQAHRELCDIVEREDISSYHGFIRYIYDVAAEYAFAMSDSRLDSRMRHYIQSRYASSAAGRERLELKEQRKHDQANIDALLAGVNVLKQQVQLVLGVDVDEIAARKLRDGGYLTCEEWRKREGEVVSHG